MTENVNLYFAAHSPGNSDAHVKSNLIKVEVAGSHNCGIKQVFASNMRGLTELMPYIFRLVNIVSAKSNMMEAFDRIVYGQHRRC